MLIDCFLGNIIPENTTVSQKCRVMLSFTLYNINKRMSRGF